METHGVSEQKGENEIERMTLLSRITNRSFIEFLKIRKGEKICDFGCGPGLLINDIDHLYDLPEIAGIEPETAIYQNAVENNLQNKNVRLIPAEPPATGLAENEYDIVFCRSFLERAKEPVVVLKEMLRVCAPGGRLFAQEGDIANLQFEPDIYGLGQFKTAYEHEMKSCKKDPFIGRRLYVIFKNAGCLHLEVTCASETHTDSHPAAYRLALQYFREQMSSPCGRGLKNPSDEVLAALEEIDRRINEPTGVLHFCWNRIEGWKW